MMSLVMLPRKEQKKVHNKIAAMLKDVMASYND